MYADKLKRSSNVELQSEAYRYAGLGKYKKHKFAEAVEEFSRLTELVSYRTDWFNLAMSHAQDGNISKSEQAFKMIYASPPISGYLHQVSVPMMLHLYASILAKQKAWDEALYRITEIKQMFEAANTDDETKLSAAGLPPLQSFYQLSELVFNNVPEGNFEKWLADMKRLKPFFDDMH